jgi:glutathione S-transferase
MVLIVADIANFGWINSHAYASVDIDEFPELKAWYEKLKARPGVAKGLAIPPRTNIPTSNDPKASNWVLQGMEADKK